MCSRFPEPDFRSSCCGLLLLTVLITGCDNQNTKSHNKPQPDAEMQRMVDLAPGLPNPMTGMRNPYENDREAINEGKRLYSWFNCVGCHAHGGGGMGPPLMDAEWIYGSEPGNVYATIVEGRPKGMPAFGGKIPDQDIWKLVAYVRSLGGLNSGLLPGASNQALHEQATNEAAGRE